MITSTYVVSIIMALSPLFNIDPKLAVAVATVESGLNANAVGSKGEIGLFQVMPRVAKAKGFTAEQLKQPVINIYVGLQILKDSKDKCVHSKDITWLVCYNYGPANAKKIKHPDKFPYVKKVKNKMGRFLASDKESKHAW